MEKKYLIQTYGCQMNEHDSEKIAYILENLGYIKTDKVENADFIIYNTCLVRENAELKVYGQLGSLKPLKKEKPEMIIAVCGCMMQTGEAKEIIQEKYKHVDIIFGTKNISSLPSLINRHLSTGKTVVDIEDRDLIDNQIDMIREHPFIGYVNIMTGCNNFCTYCIVPYARGREDSRSPESILKEVNDLAKKGYKEITLLGQNVNSYGKNLSNPISFPDLLRMINKVEGIERIRFLTSHPKDLSDDLIDAMAECDKVCENLHLPFQAGSNKVLKEMNRKYTQEDYLLLVKKLKNKIPNITLSTDIIVGFPGETEEDFEETLKVVKEVEYDQGFTFIYSKREGTKAATMENQVERSISQKRFERLLELMYGIFYKNNEKELGKTLEVLVEGPSKNNEEVLTGRTRGYKLVHFKGDKGLIGKLVNVKITGHNSFSLSGDLV
ncbi:MAG: tRNA (N6-isopentenyl adenosine(37)-C2)-methylthiotransferase MiaB [Miniphocaeibacter sp.]|uniref:tRNA (N6-isopentenyl adenosine(37)-C2)-methylthiotransferase MiaB n=1 Tax=Miniphocaeibacter sp. TaxID=3100973 RepID=UPI0017B956AF|nr:tRNA (N6-isopentenyl adenosine(37)-C2)-methylthiotransferase MiaB [Gallicola sp.]